MKVLEQTLVQGHTVGSLHINPVILATHRPSGGGLDKVSMLTHTYPHKLLRKIKVTVCNHQADSSFYVWPDV